MGEQGFKGRELWDRLETTNDKFTKRFNSGAFKGTAVDAVYNLRRVTEALGPVGFAWGWHVVDQQLVKFDAGPEPTWVHTCTVRAWFRQPEGGVREVENIGSTIAARFVGDGGSRRFSVDGDYAKKSVTDALSKIMLSLGASADIWMGRFDGVKYAEEPGAAEPGPANRPPRRPFGPEPSPPADGAAGGGPPAAAADEPSPPGPPVVEAARMVLHKLRWNITAAGVADAARAVRADFDGRPFWAQLIAADRDLASELQTLIRTRAQNDGVDLSTL